MTPAQIRQMLRSPTDMMRFQATGRAPQEYIPSSPLISLLERIGPGYLNQIANLTVDHRLGYAGTRKFVWASQALLWLKPGNTFREPLSEGWRIKSFARQLHIDDLRECCSSELAEPILRRLQALSRPATGSRAQMPRP